MHRLFQLVKRGTNNEVRAALPRRPRVGTNNARSRPLSERTADVMLQLVDDEFLFHDDRFNQIADRQNPDDPAIVEYGQVPYLLVRH